jgi:hypothetical protein
MKNTKELKRWRRKVTCGVAPPWREGYEFEGYEQSGQLVLETSCDRYHALPHLEEVTSPQ